MAAVPAESVADIETHNFDDLSVGGVVVTDGTNDLYCLFSDRNLRQTRVETVAR